MADVLELIENLSKLDVEKVVKQSILTTSETYSELNREQLKSGLKADNSVMPNYSKTSVEVFGKPSGAIMLFDTGAFHKSFKTDVAGENIIITSNDIHNLAERYSDEIFGLSDNVQEIYSENVFLPELQKEIENITGLKFE